MRSLYPEIEANHTYTLTDGSSSVYYEESGNSQGIPVIFLHGGPGSGCNDNHRRYFNSDKYRIVLMDQRGSHRSSFTQDLSDNNTQALISDIEAIRQQLNIDKWLLYGGSWGSTLALLYAQAYPDNVMGMILRGSFLAREEDLHWFLGQGVGRIFPDYWQDLTDAIAPQASVKSEVELIEALAEQILHGKGEEQFKAVKAWAMWGGRIVTSSFVDDYQLEIEDKVCLIQSTQIEMHYAMHQYFLQPDQIMQNIHRLAKMPVTLIHGRRDLTCLPSSSWALHHAIADSELQIIPAVGHLASEPAMINALINATDNMAEKLL